MTGACGPYNLGGSATIRCLPVDTPYILSHVIDHERDTPIDSFVVHSPNVGARRMRLRRKTSFVLNLP